MSDVCQCHVLRASSAVVPGEDSEDKEECVATLQLHWDSPEEGA